MKRLKSILKQEQIQLIVLILLAYFPVLFFIGSLKFDAVDITLPWRFFISECLHNGILPLWNPFINFGFPQMAEPQTWYPISLIFSWVGRYSMVELHLEFMLHLIIAGIGFYQLLSVLKPLGKLRLALSLAYVCSGFFIGNAQHFGWIISGAYVPWVWWTIIKIQTEGHAKYKLLLPVILFCFLTGGYPAFFVVNGYAVLAYIIADFYRNRKESTQLRTRLINWLTVGVLFLIVSSGVLYSSFQLGENLVRAEGLSTSAQNLGNLNISALLTLISPFLVTTQNDLWQVLDYGLVNLFVSATGLFILISAFNSISKGTRFFIFLSLFFIVLGFGSTLGILPLLSAFIPFLDLFRFPALYRYFFIVLALISIYQALNESNFNTVKVKIVLLFASIVCVLLCVLSFIQLDSQAFWGRLSNFTVEFRNFSVWERGFLWYGLYSIIGIIAWKISWKEVSKLLGFLIIAEVMIHATLYSPVSVYGFGSPDIEEQYISKLSKGFPSQDLTSATSNFGENGFIQQGFLWRNRAHYEKHLASDGYSPYVLNSALVREEKGLDTAALKLPFIYTLEGSDISIVSHDFEPGILELQVTTNKAQTLVLQQNYYAGWQATINGTPLALNTTTNHGFLETHIPPGEHRLVFEFNPTVPISLLITGLLGVVALFLVYLFYPKARVNN